MQSFLLRQILPFALPLVTGYVTTTATDALKRLSAWVDGQSAGIKHMIVAAIAFGLTQAAPLVQGLCPTDVPCDLGNLNVAALASYVVAVGLKHAQQVQR